MKKTHLVLAILSMVLITIVVDVSRCKHDPLPVPERPTHNTGGGGGYHPIYGSSGDTIKDSVCFSEEILPLIISNCAKSGCHDASASGDQMPLTNYTQIRQVTIPYNPNGSLLYQVITGAGTSMPPTGNPPLTAAQIQLIRNWIMEGSKQNIDCGMSCDTNVFTYSGAISFTIQNYCRGCHSGTTPAGGISLQNYSDVSVIAGNGKLWGSTNHLPGYQPMPLNAPMLSDCRLRQIRKWLDAGAPNN